MHAQTIAPELQCTHGEDRIEAPDSFVMFKKWF